VHIFDRHKVVTLEAATVAETVKPFYLPEKLISKHVH